MKDIRINCDYERKSRPVSAIPDGSTLFSPYARSTLIPGLKEQLTNFKYI